MKTEFSTDQYDNAYPDGIEFHWWSQARDNIVLNAVNSFSGPDTAVLEVGCGRGTVVASLRDKGIECCGVELAEVQPVSAAEPYVRTGTNATELPFEERQHYDTILLLDVVEHIAEPVPFLHELADAFPNVTRVIITVPARQEIWSNYDEYYGHYRRYTVEMLDDLSTDLGWALPRKSYFFHLVYFPAWILAKLKKNRETRIVPPQGMARLIHRLVSYAMLFDYHLLPRRMAGTSVMGCFQPRKRGDGKR